MNKTGEILSSSRDGGEERGGFGLSDGWDSIEEILTQVIPVYDKTNRFISFGTDLKVRKEGVSALLSRLKEAGKNSFNVLDVGSGPGRMTQLITALDANNGPARIGDSVMFDALRPMMNVALERNKSSGGMLGIYEAIPLRARSFASVMAGFAIRDSRNLQHALSEIHRILEDEGYFLIVDLSRPDSRTKSVAISVYWKAIAPFIAFIAAGRLGLKFGALYDTYKRLPRKREFLEMLRLTGFEVTQQQFRMLDGVCIILLRKKSI